MRLVAVLLLCFLADALAKSISSPVNPQDRHEELMKFWTPERRARAIPKMPHYNSTTQKVPPINPNVKPSFSAPSVPKKDSRAPANLGNYAPSYTDYPWRTVGKLFFFEGGVEYVCSGAVVNEYIIYTAGHCVYEIGVGWNTNLVFYPGYNEGNAPYGGFSYYQSWAETSYVTGSTGEAYDYGIVVFWGNSLGNLGSVVGWLGAAWNFGYGQVYTALGYPSEEPFDGQLDYYCYSGQIGTDTAFTPNPIQIACDSTGGCSGGPWVVGWQGENYINSVNAYRYGDANSLYGPYFDSNSQSLFEGAVAVVP